MCRPRYCVRANIAHPIREDRSVTGALTSWNATKGPARVAVAPAMDDRIPGAPYSEFWAVDCVASRRSNARIGDVRLTDRGSEWGSGAEDTLPVSGTLALCRMENGEQVGRVPVNAGNKTAIDLLDSAARQHIPHAGTPCKVTRCATACRPRRFPKHGSTPSPFFRPHCHPRYVPITPGSPSAPGTWNLCFRGH
jgi:hypothetical protein